MDLRLYIARDGSYFHPGKRHEDDAYWEMADGRLRKYQPFRLTGHVTWDYTASGVPRLPQNFEGQLIWENWDLLFPQAPRPEIFAIRDTRVGGVR